VSPTSDDVAVRAARFARAAPPFGGGALAADTVALAAGLCESIARHDLEHWPEARGLAVQATILRARAGAAASDNQRAYATARGALAGPGHEGETGRDANLRAALMAAADTLLAVAALAADGAGLAAELAHGCDPALRADAVTAAELAAAAARSAATLVEVNLALLPNDDRRRRAAQWVAGAQAACQRARESL
jgi:formiminotetrahydrofolate cyclodeaminase